MFVPVGETQVWTFSLDPSHVRNRCLKQLTIAPSSHQHQRCLGSLLEFSICLSKLVVGFSINGATVPVLRRTELLPDNFHCTSRLGFAIFVGLIKPRKTYLVACVVVMSIQRSTLPRMFVAAPCK